ncbi:exodeoxyribonuclease VII large subunit [Corynebacterium sp.]|uniref:exodeoxyribonuclease VII large subunit n=1 Tax=Corynebacterium sp. TaxID=1720 RepID=UPI0026DCFBC4|nr:exodeoxyribonuclease VII large subunit [Corynebacterium sp.]MDO4610706.1 exodeoxyribonuclease VII large subunit [Corynebacterium sp.]
MALSTSPESPVPVREFNALVKGWIDRLGGIWVEGQVAQVSAKPNWSMAYVVLRDPEVENSVQVTCTTAALKRNPLQTGDRVVVYGKPDFYSGRGSFSLRAAEWRPIGVGELLARIERIRTALSAEGLFDPRLKRTPPFLPRRIGLITGRASAAERDVLSVARMRWPGVDFDVRNTAVQGPRTVPEVISALESLDADPAVDVIIIARGGGSVEDLLPFSEEMLLRSVAKARTPVVSAIGHEPDQPLLDLVADVRAATPTDAAKRIVPDAAEESRRVAEMRDRAAAALRRWVDREAGALSALRSRPALADPMGPVRARSEELERATLVLRQAIRRRLDAEDTAVGALRGKVSALGPAATLARGYAVVQVQPRDHSGDQVVTTIKQTPPGSQLRIRVADGAITAATMGVRHAD